jgi:hypothetical protein
VILIGDSLLNQAATRLPSVYAFDGADVTVRDVTALGTGLLHQISGLTIHQYVAAKLAEFPNADTVVFSFTGVCPCVGIVYGSADFYRKWYAAARDIVNFARAKGVTVLWAIEPPASAQRVHQDVLQGLSQRDRVFVAQNGLVGVDWWEAFTDVQNQYQPYLFYADFFDAPRIHKVRLDDGLHFEPDGVTRAARWIATSSYDAWRAGR